MKNKLKIIFYKKKFIYYTLKLLLKFCENHNSIINKKFNNRIYKINH